MIKLNNVR